MSQKFESKGKKNSSITILPQMSIGVEFNMPILGWNDSMIVLTQDSLSKKLDGLISIDSMNPMLLKLDFPWLETATYHLTIFPKGVTGINQKPLQDTLTRKIVLTPKEKLGNILLTLQPPDSTKQYVVKLKQKNKEDVAALKHTLEMSHAQEREKIQINAERAKTRLVKKTQQQISKESKIAHGKANFKVGAALAGVMGLGALMLLTQFLTIGIFTLTTAGGVLGGYLYRGRKDKQDLLTFKNSAQNESQIAQHSQSSSPKLIPADKAQHSKSK